MNIPAKVLWGEGLFLRPQHFQQQDRYHEARLGETASALHPYCWGVRRLEIDADALRADVLRVVELALIFPDGEIVRAPGPDPLPQQVRLGDLPPDMQSLTFHAALPALKLHGENCAARGDAAPAQLVRYGQREHDTDDLFGESAPAPVAYLTKTVRLVPDLEPLDAYDSVPLVRLHRVATGGFEIDQAFTPPSLSIDGAPGLHARLVRLMEKLLAKVHALYGHYREPGRNVIALRGGDVASFWLLHTVSAGHAALGHYLAHRDLHPERLFQDLLALAGGLMTFSRGIRLEDLPAYAHHDPGPAFARLDAILRELLDTVISSKYFAIALAHERPSYHLGALDSGKIDAHTTLYLGVAADLPALQLVEVVPLRFKIGAPEDVDKLVLSAMPGVRLAHAPQVPAALPVRPDMVYFVLENRGVLYDCMLKAQAISIYVPNGIRDLKLELIAIAA
ncbi:type VI secretion system baseplate subunit TssK [uncultured Massilia sp.]|uniref:type VI secretion system baseplate subunit TssK n=1 Tax=uncultured Massilia sp. TaxID=169973 RepID=UPI0025F350FA|nr:type VI secretion system baseplate subunit TssK [uncultured Massilia sp.]